jgi:hypothetical protein
MCLTPLHNFGVKYPQLRWFCNTQLLDAMLHYFDTNMHFGFYQAFCN